MFLVCGVVDMIIITLLILLYYINIIKWGYESAKKVQYDQREITLPNLESIFNYCLVLSTTVLYRNFKSNSYNQYNHIHIHIYNILDYSNNNNLFQYLCVTLSFQSTGVSYSTKI